jgi:predicted translation initiation factor SUI1
VKRQPQLNSPLLSACPQASSGDFADFFAETFGHTTSESPDAIASAPGNDANELRGPGGQKLRANVLIERKGRRGKTVTIVRGVELAPAALETLSKQLRQRCGAGGTIAGGDIELQGDQRIRAADYLESKGVRVTRSGG